MTESQRILSDKEIDQSKRRLEDIPCKRNIFHDDQWRPGTCSYERAGQFRTEANIDVGRRSSMSNPISSNASISNLTTSESQ
jgi:hypothetical protein